MSAKCKRSDRWKFLESHRFASLEMEEGSPFSSPCKSARGQERQADEKGLLNDAKKSLSAISLVSSPEKELFRNLNKTKPEMVEAPSRESLVRASFCEEKLNLSGLLGGERHSEGKSIG